MKVLLLSSALFIHFVVGEEPPFIKYHDRRAVPGGLSDPPPPPTVASPAPPPLPQASGRAVPPPPVPRPSTSGPRQQWVPGNKSGVQPAHVPRPAPVTTTTAVPIPARGRWIPIGDLRNPSWRWVPEEPTPTAAPKTASGHWVREGDIRNPSWRWVPAATAVATPQQRTAVGPTTTAAPKTASGHWVRRGDIRNPNWQWIPGGTASTPSKGIVVGTTTTPTPAPSTTSSTTSVPPPVPSLIQSQGPVPPQPTGQWVPPSQGTVEGQWVPEDQNDVTQENSEPSPAGQWVPGGTVVGTPSQGQWSQGTGNQVNQSPSMGGIVLGAPPPIAPAPRPFNRGRFSRVRQQHRRRFPGGPIRRPVAVPQGPLGQAPTSGFIIGNPQPAVSVPQPGVGVSPTQVPHGLGGMMNGSPQPAAHPVHPHVNNVLQPTTSPVPTGQYTQIHPGGITIGNPNPSAPAPSHQAAPGGFLIGGPQPTNQGHGLGAAGHSPFSFTVPHVPSGGFPGGGSISVLYLNAVMVNLQPGNAQQQPPTFSLG